jgi:hypothetical protein
MNAHTKMTYGWRKRSAGALFVVGAVTAITTGVGVGAQAAPAEGAGSATAAIESTTFRWMDQAAMLSPPGSPTGVTATVVTSDYRTFRVAWTAGRSGSSATTGYTATAAGGFETRTCASSATARSCTMTVNTSGLYQVTVVARSGAGNSAPSTAISYRACPPLKICGGVGLHGDSLARNL